MHTQHDSSMSEGYVSGEEEADRDTFNSIIKTRPIIARTGLVYTSLMMLHTVPSSEDVGETDVHPEQPERISRIFGLLKNQGCVSRMKRIPIREATESEVTLVHKQSIWDACQRSAFFSHETLAAQIPSLEMSSLYINEHSARCARLSCGGVIEMCDAVASGRIQNGFAIVRPPGHHGKGSMVSPFPHSSSTLIGIIKKEASEGSQGYSHGEQRQGRQPGGQGRFTGFAQLANRGVSWLSVILSIGWMKSTLPSPTLSWTALEGGEEVGKTTQIRLSIVQPAFVAAPSNEAGDRSIEPQSKVGSVARGLDCTCTYEVESLCYRSGSVGDGYVHGVMNGELYEHEKCEAFWFS